MKHRLPEYYEKEMLAPLSDEKKQEFVASVTDILKGLDKGLSTLKSIGKAPDTKVLENEKRFKAILDKLKSM